MKNFTFHKLKKSNKKKDCGELMINLNIFIQKFWGLTQTIK